MRTFKQHRFLILLCLLFLLFLSAAIVSLISSVEASYIARVITGVFFVTMLLSAVLAVSERRISIAVAWTLAAPCIVLQALSLWSGRPAVSDALREGILIALHVVDSLFLIYTVVMIMMHLFASRKVTAEMINAAMCVFLLIGVLWAILYSFTAIIQKDSFSVNDTLSERVSGLDIHFGGKDTIYVLYYSYVTLTTLGYGDISPVSPVACALSALEAILGQLYLTVLIARLVGLHIAQSGAT